MKNQIEIREWLRGHGLRPHHLENARLLSSGLSRRRTALSRGIEIGTLSDQMYLVREALREEGHNVPDDVTALIVLEELGLINQFTYQE